MVQFEKYATLALVVEQVFRKDEVPGSSPGGGSQYFSLSDNIEFVYFTRHNTHMSDSSVEFPLPKIETKIDLISLTAPFIAALESTRLNMSTLGESVRTHAAFDTFKSNPTLLGGLLAEIHVEDVINRTAMESGWMSLSVRDLLLPTGSIARTSISPMGAIEGFLNRDLISGRRAEVDCGFILTPETSRDGDRPQIPLAIEVKISQNEETVKSAMTDRKMRATLEPLRRLIKQTIFQIPTKDDPGLYMLVVGKDSLAANHQDVLDFKSRGGIYVVLPTNRQELTELAEKIPTM